MRQDILDISLVFENENVMKSFYNALRFSTHGRYKFHSPFKSVTNRNYNYIEQHEFPEERNGTIESEIFINKVGAIGVKYNGNYRRPAIPSKESNSTHVFLDGVENQLLYLFTAKIDRGAISKIVIDKDFKKDRFSFAVEPYTRPGILLVEESGDDHITRHFGVEDLPILDLARLYGMNLPLILIQDIMGRKVSATCMVDRLNVCHKTRKILLGQREIFFDLDETLIWDGHEIHEAKALLRRSRDAGRENILITRHEEADILPTLSLIGLSENDFESIQFVSKAERKSSFVGPHAVFIDNEYPERLDVRRQSNACVLDLDVIDRVVFA